jgi:hypothetical protein
MSPLEINLMNSNKFKLIDKVFIHTCFLHSFSLFAFTSINVVFIIAMSKLNKAVLTMKNITNTIFKKSLFKTKLNSGSYIIKRNCFKIFIFYLFVSYKN